MHLPSSAPVEKLDSGTAACNSSFSPRRRRGSPCKHCPEATSTFSRHPFPGPTAIEFRSADFNPPRSRPAKTAVSGPKSAFLSCRKSLNSMPVLPGLPTPSSWREGMDRLRWWRYQATPQSCRKTTAESSLLFSSLGDTPRFVLREAENPEHNHSNGRTKRDELVLRRSRRAARADHRC